jgi:CheY-like chemotaxis protein
MNEDSRMITSIAASPGNVAITGWGQEEDRRKAREAGIDHHMIKPADIGQLQDLLVSLAR